MSKTRTITTAKDVTEEVINAALEIADGWYPDGPIEWDSVFDRLEGWTGWDFGTSWDTPALRKIKREVLKIRRES